MQSLDTIHDYLRAHSDKIGKRILSSYPALHGAARPSRVRGRGRDRRVRHRHGRAGKGFPRAVEERHRVLMRAQRLPDARELRPGRRARRVGHRRADDRPGGTHRTRRRA